MKRSRKVSNFWPRLTVVRGCAENAGPVDVSLELRQRSRRGATACALDAKAGLLFVVGPHTLYLIRVVPTLPFEPPPSIDYLSDLLVQENSADSFPDVTFQVEGRPFLAHQVRAAQPATGPGVR